MNWETGAFGTCWGRPGRSLQTGHNAELADIESWGPMRARDCSSTQASTSKRTASRQPAPFPYLIEEPRLASPRATSRQLAYRTLEALTVHDVENLELVIC